jgi:hypothetical protein
MANVRKQRVVVIHPRVDETSFRGTDASGKVDNLDAKTGSEGEPSSNASRIEFGWDVFDFPFNSPKPTR